MRPRSYERLCTELGALLGHAPDPRFRDGIWMQTWAVGDIDVFLLHSPRTDPGRASIATELGLLEERSEQQGWLEFLDANHDVEPAGGGSYFGRNPATGAVMLQFGFDIAAHSAEHVHAAMVEVARKTVAWRGRQAFRSAK